MTMHRFVDFAGDQPLAVHLDSQALIEVRGDDAAAFLHGQLSNDVNQSREAICQLNVYCNPKGRALAVLHLLRVDDGFWLIAPRAVAAQLTARLKMFVLRADVSIEINSSRAMRGVLNVAQCAPADGVVCAEAARLGFVLIGETAALDAMCAQHQWTQKPDDDLWRARGVLSGVAQVYEQTIGEFIPQTVNLDLVDAVSVTKGCYPGQEIIARLRHRGKVKQRLRAFVARNCDAIAPGARVVSLDSPEKKIGVVVDAIQFDDLQLIGASVALDFDAACVGGQPVEMVALEEGWVTRDK